MATKHRPLLRIITETRRHVKDLPLGFVRYASSTCSVNQPAENTPVFRAPVSEGRQGGGGSSSRTCLLRAAALGLGLSALYGVNNERDKHVSIKTRPVTNTVLHCVVPTAYCASAYKGDSPRSKYNFIADVVEKSAPAVVYIDILGR